MHIVYIGNEVGIIDTLAGIAGIDVIACIHQKSKSTAQCSSKDVTFCPVATKKDFCETISLFYDKISFAIMYSFGIIIPNNVVTKLQIFNFHPGDLRTNRGSSPINWSILLNNNRTMMTLHHVDAGIDTGEIITEHECRIYENDVPYTLQKRMEGEIPSMMLELLHQIAHGGGGGYKVVNGAYRNRITEDDYTIKDSDDRKIIGAKIRSQYIYQGAILRLPNGQKKYVKSLEEYDAILGSHKNETHNSGRWPSRDTC